MVAYVLQILKAAGAPMDDDRFWHEAYVLWSIADMPQFGGSADKDLRLPS